MDERSLLEGLADLAEAAGREILKVRSHGFSVRTKKDESPLTEADLASNKVIAAGLAELVPDVPVLSEESDQPPWVIRRNWDRFLLVDPLDGTKEFIKDNGEFCVCIALVEGVHPTLGVVHAPTLEATWYGGPGLGVLRRNGKSAPWSIQAVPPGKEGLVAVASRSHPDKRLETILQHYRVTERVTAGSAIKFALLAEGGAHLYPRLNPTMEWDTAAGQALVEGSGGSFVRPDGRRFAYNKQSLVNGGFLARAPGVDFTPFDPQTGVLLA